MPEPWSQLREIDQLANGQVDIDFAIPAAEFSRLPPQPEGSRDTVHGRAQFRREGGFAVTELDVAGAVQLVCQRCLAPLHQSVTVHALIALVVSEAEADRVPPEFEPVHAPAGRIRVRDLVEEEVLLALPIVPLHENPHDCAPAAQIEVASAAPAEADAAASLQKPFERLGELLKRGK
jgi:uncharacterized protein